MEALERRLTAVELKADALARRMDQFSAEMKENTDTTNEIKADTTQMIALFRASLLGANIIKWLATVGGGVIVAYAAIKGLGVGGH
jgi:hypothetical protein